MWATVGVLGVLTAGLAVAGAFREPRLDAATVAAESALRIAGERLVLHADQAIGPVDVSDVRVTPDVPIEVSSDGRSVTLRFSGMLRALTEYTVSVDVTGISTGVDGTLEHAFSTPDLEVAVLVRDVDGKDEVRRRQVSGGDADVLFAADRIQEFALTRDGVAVVLLDDTGPNGRLVIAPEGEDRTQEVALPSPGRVRDLQVSDTTGRLGVTFSSAHTGAPDSATSRLLLFDPLEPSGLLRPIVGLDGEPLSVLDWMFVPGTAYLVAHAFDESLLLVDTASPDELPVPLGEHSEMRGFLPGTLQLVVADPLSGGLIDLETGRTTPLVLPDDGLDASTYRGAVLTLAEDRYIEVASRPTEGPGFVLDYQIVSAGPESAEAIYDPDPGIRIRDICLSPNAQFLAVEVQDPEGEPDGYLTVPGWTRSTTYFVDIETGSANRAILGFASSWCA